MLAQINEQAFYDLCKAPLRCFATIKFLPKGKNVKKLKTNLSWQGENLNCNY